MKSKAEVQFYGKVQGVFFRAYTRDFAQKNGVNGWVMNLPDGSVRAVFEGEKEDILEVIRLLREEHPHAVVDDMEIEWKKYQGSFSDFSVRYSR